MEDMTWEEVEAFGPEKLELTAGQEKVFVKAFRTLSDIGKRLDAAGLINGRNLDLIRDTADVSDEPVTFEQYTSVAKKLYLLGELKPAQAVAEPGVERDKLGRPLSPKALQWKRWEEWCNDPATKMSEITPLRRTDPKFAEFYSHQTNLRVKEEGIGDAVEAVGTQAVRQDQTRATEDLRAFADAYRRTSTADVKKFSSPALNPLGYKQYTENLDRAIAAGLI